MRIRFQVQYGLSTFPFEHGGPVVELGRAPENTLAFPAAAGHSVDWHHARIELTPDGAFLEDRQSEAGTYLNDRRIAGRTQVALGDKIMLGAGGPLLEVDRLEVGEEGVLVTAADIVETPAAKRPGRHSHAAEPAPVETRSAAAIIGTVLVVGLAFLAIALTVAVIVAIIFMRQPRQP